MSRVGKLPIIVPDNIKVDINGKNIKFVAGAVEKNYTVSKGVVAKLEDKVIKLTSEENSQSNISMFVGMNRSNIKNIVSGLSSGFKVVLEINGVGYKALVEKDVLIMSLGFSHEIFYALPLGIKASFEKPNLIIISGDNKVLVGQVASEIISFRKPEPYKGKGVKIFGKQILRKEGKKK
jgi:large subunit ribosomal protein L6